MADNSKTNDEKMLEMAGKMAEKIVEGLIPQLVATANILQKGNVQQASPQSARKEYCHECDQVKTICNGEHSKVVVLPTHRPEFAKWFQGYKLNGVNYLSDRPGHAITVPKCMAAEIVNGVRLWEDTEYAARQGKTAEHFSGSVTSPSRVENDGTRFR